MKKLKLKNLSAIGNVLTSEELKHVYGGSAGVSGGSCTCTLYHRVLEGHTYIPPEVNSSSAEGCRSNCRYYLNQNVQYYKALYSFKDHRCGSSHYNGSGGCGCESGWVY